MGALPLDWLQLVAAGALVVVGIAFTRTFRLGLEIDLAWAAARTVAQLLLVGYVLLWIFDQDAIYFVNGEVDKAREILDKVLEGTYWSAFGYIAAEADVKRMEAEGASN